MGRKCSHLDHALSRPYRLPHPAEAARQPRKGTAPPLWGWKPSRAFHGPIWRRWTSRTKPGRLNKDLPEKGLIAIDIPPRRWSGPFNPDPEDTVPASIRFFGGIGRDADGDGKADPDNDMDALYSFARHLAEFGHSRDDIRMGLWKYYRHPAAVDIITHMARIYETFGSLDLKEHHFPIPLHYNYTYRSTWGDRRGWGGLTSRRNRHLCGLRPPVLSTCYGYVELMGWNRYGDGGSAFRIFTTTIINTVT